MAKTEDKKNCLIIVAGPTAVGKTALSIKLAQHFNCPILSFDSRQFFKEMSIGTAKPTPDELAQAPHHFIGNLSIKDRYTAGIYEQEALERLDEVFKTHQYCVAVGGSGLYIDALAFGIDDIPADEKVRTALQERWKNEGLAVLQEEVLAIDPDFYHESDMMNPRRVVRALEVYQITGKKYSSLRKKEPKKRPFNMHWIGLNLPRPELFDRINQRVDIMVENGLEKEAKSLYPLKSYKALKTVGYREFFDYFDEKVDRQRAIDSIKKNTRLYAKRQVTWFTKNQAVNWYQPNEYGKILEEIPK